jgi:transcriptional regulator with XRE-family HTH domain
MTEEKQRLKQLGAHVKKLRVARGYSQDRLYLEGGFSSRGTISKVERGLVNPGYLTLLKIAETIGVPLKKLVDVPAE